MQKIQRKWGWKPDLPDVRDYQFQRIRPKRRLPTTVDLRGKCSSVEDQGSLGSCTANAGVGVYECLENIEGMTFFDGSRLALYYMMRAIEGTTSEDAGGTIRDTFKAMIKSGVGHESIWPYIISKFAKKPPQKLYADASRHKIMVYQRLNTIGDMLNCLANGFPFEFGFTVYESFESDKVARTGIVPMPKKTERILGGHAVVAVGYGQKKNYLLVRNSWGVGWGVKGYFYLPYKYAEDRNLSDDFWMASKES